MMKMEKRPFRSVKEAVELYGKRILDPELYANVLQEMESEENEEENNLLKMKSVRDELEVAKQKLEEAKERSVAMARSLSSLQQELEDTKRKLQMLKDSSKYDDVIESIDASWKHDYKTQSQRFEEEEEAESEKQHVAFDSKMTENKKKKKTSNKTKKSSIFFIGGFFSKK